MMLARHLALLLAAAILAITVGMAPSAALAHPGHGAFEIEFVTHSVDVNDAQADAHEAKADPAQSRSSAMDDLRIAKFGGLPWSFADLWSASDRLNCGSPCCASGAHSSSCCCATALAPAEAIAAMPPPAIAPERRRDPPTRVGIAPEALPEPPRPNA